MPAAKALTGTAAVRHQQRRAAREAAGLTYADVARALSRGRRLTDKQLKNKIATVQRIERHGGAAPVLAHRLARVYRRGPLLFL